MDQPSIFDKLDVLGCLGVAMHRSVFFALAACAVITSCSAVKASQKTGVEIADVAKCEAVSCFYAHPTMTLLGIEEMKADNSHYRFSYQRRQGSVLRGVGYGLVGVYTLGLSEVVTNPVEGSIQNDKIFIVDAICDKRTETCETVTITQSGEPVRVVRGEADDFTRLRAD